MKNTRNIFLVFCVISLCLLGCSMFTQKRTAESEIKKFHSEFNAGNYSKLYREGDDLVFKSARSEQVFVKKLEDIKNKLGEVKSSKVTGSSSRDHNRGTDIYLTCETEFANGKAREKFTYVFIGDKVLLEGYEFNP